MTQTNVSSRVAERLHEDYGWTPRQREVLDLLVKGRTNAEIAEALGVTLDGAEYHLREILSKLGVESREEAAEYWRAYRGLDRRLGRAFRALAAGSLAKWAAAGAGVTGVAGGSLLVAMAVLGDGHEDPGRAVGASRTPTAAALASPTPAAAAGAPTSPASPTTAPGAPGTVASTVQVIDARTGVATTLYQSAAERAWDARFAGDTVVVSAGSQVRHFLVDGRPAPASTASCEVVNGAARIDGRDYPGVTCGSFSPDGRRMTYEVGAGVTTVLNGYEVPVWNQRVLEVSTGATRELQAGLVHCGGCDGMWGPRWSASSRYLAYAELGGEQRRFLSDVTTGATRQFGNGQGLNFAPAWSPEGDQLVYPLEIREGAAARLEDSGGGATWDLPIPWPVRFDTSGRFVYSPAWGDDRKSPAGSTTIVDVASMKVVATLPGEPRWGLWNDLRAVGIYRGGYLAALQRAPGCEGTAIYVEGQGAPHCVAGGAEGIPNPDGSLVAVARVVGEIGGVVGPGFAAMSIARYSVVVVDTATSSERTVVAEAFSSELVPPLMVWNSAGTHLLVVWPMMEGL
jgi:DNA-binding CsgD family transcriptional regulator